MKLKLSSKSRTLEELEKVITSATILPQYNFFANEYKGLKNKIINDCLKSFNRDVIVRSSSANEDNLEKSNAGGFDSVANVQLSKKYLDNAILKVIDSYGDSLCHEDKILIQPMLKNVSMSGVIFTSDIDTLAPYYIINYDESGSTSSVTNGEGEDLTTVIVFKDYFEKIDKKIMKLIIASKECENIFDNNYLDIEFAFIEDELYLLQVRAIVKQNKNNLSSINLSESLKKLHKKIKKLNAPHPKLLGSKSIFGVMPDWNPAEIIGVKPKKLSLSLYKEIITDEIWAYQRDNYGYRNLRSFPLLVSLIGVPFIDVRVSFNSFIPKNLENSISSKLVEYYLSKLSENLNNHDKIEFEIVYSCYYFGINNKLMKLKSKGFSNSEIKSIEIELLKLTNNILDIKNGLYKKDLYKIELLKEKYNDIVNSKLSTIDKIYWLIEDCKRYGTLPFAGVARAAFIAVQFLNSLVEEEILTNTEKNKFLNSIRTISKRLNYDKDNLNKKDFLDKYGHLRPGTYDICSKRYDEAYKEYFSDLKYEIEEENFEFSELQKNKISKLIIKNGLECDFYGLIKFIRESIEGREYSKFIFTKHLSKILIYIEELGLKFGFSREELAYVDIKTIKNMYATLDYRNVKNILKNDIDENKEFYKYTQAIKLPSVIIQENDIFKFTLEKEKPNFVTLNSVNGLVVDLDLKDNIKLDHKIICIKSADPGYDYLFSKNINGLITCYGGANSHMSIRCAELGIPAVIGCGEKMFTKYKNAHTLYIDSANQQVKILS